MKDQADKQTIEAFPLPRRRGRPASGKALTAAERQRRYRDAHKGEFIVTRKSVKEIDQALKDENEALKTDIARVRRILDAEIRDHAATVKAAEADKAALNYLVKNLQEKLRQAEATKRPAPRKATKNKAVTRNENEEVRP